MDVNTLRLMRIDDGISDRLREEICTLVAAKYLVDELARDPVGRRLTRAFHDGGYGPRHGTELFRTVLPFADIEFEGEDVCALVPTAQTIGAGWNWTTSSLSKKKSANPAWPFFSILNARSISGSGRSAFSSRTKEKIASVFFGACGWTGFPRSCRRVIILRQTGLQSIA
jgi:hypothetical protein